jgi:phenylpyruvate tautomerase PptA (4-oxalocrotonate tautomerase family)
MAMVVCSIPKGYSVETKKRLIAALGDVECIGFDMDRQFEHVYLQEFDTEHCDETMKRTKYVVIYTGAGKKTSAKAKIAELFKQKIDEVFGPEDTDYASVVIEEHVNELIACEGMMRCEDPVAVAAQLAFQK